MAQALTRHEARMHRKGIPAIVQAVDLVNRTVDVYLKDEQVLADKIPYDADLYLVAGDQVLVEVQGGRSYFIRSKSAPIGGAVPSVGAALFLIKNTTLTVAAATVDFTNIPQSFRHLELVCQMRGDTAATNVAVGLRFNNDSGANYDYIIMAANATAAGVGEGLAQTQMQAFQMSGATAPANSADGFNVLIHNYASTIHRKAITSLNSEKLAETTTNIYLRATAGWWRSTAAIDRVTILPASGNFVVGCVFSLYGRR